MTAVRPSSVLAALAVGATLPALTAVVLPPLLLRLVVVWAVTAAGCVLARGRIRHGRSASALLAVVAAACTACVASLPRGRAASLPEAVAIGLVDGPRLLVETTVPVAGTAEQSVPLVLLVGIATVLASALAQLSRPGLALIPSLAVLLVLTVLAAGYGAGVFVAAASWCSAAGAMLAATRDRGTAHVGDARAGWVVSVLILAVLMAGAGSAAVASAAPQAYDPHHTELPTVPDAPRTNPLDVVSAWRAVGRDTPLFEVSGLSGRLTWVTLEAYDGVSWSTEQPLAPSGPVIDGPSLSWPVQERCAVITPAAGFSGPLLPVPASVRRVDGMLITASGTGGIVAAAQPGPLPQYRACGDSFSEETSRAISSRLGTATSTGLGPGVASALPEGGAQSVDRITVAALDGLRDYADKVSGDGAALTRLQALAQFLRTGGRYGVSLSGSGAETDGTTATEYSSTLVSTQRLLAAGLTGQRPRARAELYPQAFAVLARVLGVPSRVVVGFDARTGQVGTAQSLVWPEVWVDGAGWLAFDVTPSRTGGEAASFEEESTPTSIANDQAAEPDDPPVEEPAPPVTANELPWRPVAACVVVVLFVGWPVALAAFRWSRRRRLARWDDARASVAGVWRGLLLDLRDAGVPVDDSRVPTAWADHLPQGRDAITELGGLADRALYSVEPLRESHARRATELATVVRQSVMRDLRGRDRLLHLVSPGGRRSM